MGCRVRVVTEGSGGDGIIDDDHDDAAAFSAKDSDDCDTTCATTHWLIDLVFNRLPS